MNAPLKPECGGEGGARVSNDWCINAVGPVVDKYTTCYAAPLLKNLDPASELEQLTLAYIVLIISISSPF